MIKYIIWYNVASGTKVHLKKLHQRLHDFEVLSRQRGLPVTMQRRVVLETVLERCDHPTADQIFERVQNRIPTISRTTVYRVLETLVNLAVIRRVDHPGAMARYDGRITRHHHFVCMRCNKIIDFESAELDKLALPRDSETQGFNIADYSVHFSGVCPECQRKES